MDISAVVIVIIIIVECYDNQHCSSSSQIRDVHTDGIFAADIGAAAYAESVQDCSFSTQEVIDSMLEHDKCFQGLLVEASTDFEIDIWELRFAVVDAYRHFKEYEEIMISKGKLKQRWATEAPRNAVIWSSGGAGGIAGLEDTRSIHMVIPGAWNSKENVALQLLYTYWGIPVRNEVYSW